MPIIDNLLSSDNPKTRIVQLINDSQNTNYSVNDFIFSSPAIPVEADRVRNTRVTLTPVSGAGLYATLVVWYNRIFGGDLGVINVVKGSAVTIYDLLPTINTTLGTNITTDDVEDGSLAAPDVSGYVTVNLVFKATSLLFYGGALLNLTASFTPTDKVNLDALVANQIARSDLDPIGLGPTALAGTSAEVSRQDHRHPLPALASTDSAGLMAASDKVTLNTLVAANAAILSNSDPSSLGAINSPGVGSSASRFDHVHAYPEFVDLLSKPTTIAGYGITDALTLGNVVGVALGTASAGVATTAARSDHVHPMIAVVTTATNGLMIAADKTKLDGLNNLQTQLVSGTNIKTINSTSLLGGGDIAVQPVLVSGTNIKTINTVPIIGAGDLSLQATLVSGTNIKTINAASILGSGNLSLQSTLVSGTNIKTINGSSILGSGDIVVQTSLVSGTDIKTLNGQSIVGPGNITTGSSFTPYEFVATAGQTVFNATYAPGLLRVFFNGRLLRVEDYTATNGTSVTLAVAAAATDEITILAFDYFNVANTYTTAAIDAYLAAKQATLVSGTNVKTINNTSLLGSGNISILGKLPITPVSTAAQLAVADNHYVVSGPECVITLPATPTSGDIVRVTITNGLYTNSIARNGNSIMELLEDLVLNSLNPTVTLQYLNSSWRFV